MLIFKIILVKSLIIFSYVFILIILLSKIFPQYEKESYDKLSIYRIFYEILLETILLLLIVLTSKCIGNVVTSKIFSSDISNILYYISYSLIVSILFTTINKSYKNKILLLKNKLM